MRAGAGTGSKPSECSRTDRLREVSLLGRGEETENHINEALRLSPRDTNAYLWLMIAGIAKALVGSDEKAVALLRQGLRRARSALVKSFGFPRWIDAIAQRPSRRRRQGPWRFLQSLTTNRHSYRED